MFMRFYPGLGIGHCNFHHPHVVQAECETLDEPWSDDDDQSCQDDAPSSQDDSSCVDEARARHDVLDGDSSIDSDASDSEDHISQSSLSDQSELDEEMDEHEIFD